MLYHGVREEAGSTYSFVVDVVILTTIVECVSDTGTLVLHQMFICDLLLPKLLPVFLSHVVDGCDKLGMQEMSSMCCECVQTDDVMLLYEGTVEKGWQREIISSTDAANTSM